MISVPIVWATQKCSFEFQVQVLLTSFRHSSGHCVSRHISQLQCSSQKHVWGLEQLLPVQPYVFEGQPFVAGLGTNGENFDDSDWVVVPI